MADTIYNVQSFLVHMKKGLVGKYEEKFSTSKYPRLRTVEKSQILPKLDTAQVIYSLGKIQTQVSGCTAQVRYGPG